MQARPGSPSRAVTNGEGKESQLATEDFEMREKRKLRIKNNQVQLRNSTLMFLC